MDYDVIIIGGGIVGAGVLRDCALRGLRTLLLEKGEPGAATTGASTHLIHGGLRYLLYDRLTTHTTSWDSGNIVRIARPLLTRLPVVWPVYRGHSHGPTTVETLLESYDSFARMKEGLPHLRMPPAEVLRLFPSLEPEGLVCAFAFDEWWVDPEALVQANLRAAGAGSSPEGDRPRRASGIASAAGERSAETAVSGAAVRARTAATGLVREGGRVRGVETVDASGRKEVLRASVVVNAAGPWVDQVASMAGIRIPLRLQKGTHLVYARPVIRPGLPLEAAGDSGVAAPPLGLLLEASGRDRYIFALSVQGGTFVGPTDLPFPEGPDNLRTEADEIRYLLDSVRRYLRDFPGRFDRTTVGARPILRQRGSEKLLSREFEILEHGSRDGVGGFITAAGGKMSDFRLMAQEAVDAACRGLGVRRDCRTHLTTLAGEPLGEPADRFQPPSRPMGRFLRRHPHLREWHALAHLGVELGRHLSRQALGAPPGSSVEDFLRHYYGDRTPSPT